MKLDKALGALAVLATVAAAWPAIKERGAELRRWAEAHSPAQADRLDQEFEASRWAMLRDLREIS